jgi:hypothetical protein
MIYRDSEGQDSNCIGSLPLAGWPSVAPTTAYELFFWAPWPPSQPVTRLLHWSAPTTSTTNQPVSWTNPPCIEHRGVYKEPSQEEAES